ncbi:MAG: type IV secretion system DNA-binding domain-containing protein [Candidatus Doudnabacteria bacterium]|nr:type IV secretion system DNA-binding domain-containing protein [Candidatus Doudnabacteria bacterium]
MENTKHENIITVFAKTNFRNKEVPFGIKTDDRRRHMYLIGKTGMGKTTLMENMVIQDIRNGHGVAFLDPHGDSVQRILDSIPSSRVNDVIYFNPADLDYPVAFNILEAVDTKYKHLVASGLMGVFTKIWANLWSARMEYILNNTILALLDSPGNTLLGITRMYVDKKYRKKIVDNVKDPMVKAFWTDEFANYNEKYRTEAIAPIQNKVGQFLSSGIIRNIVGQPKSTIDLREIMDKKKILIMDLSKGKVGEDNSALLGAMVVTKLQLAAMSRTDIPEHERQDFYLYVDEFQNFATDSFATILSEARKYRLNLIVGHQYIGQLVQERNTKVRDAIFGNVGTLVVFRVGAEDAEFLVKEFEPIFTEVDIVNLPKYYILLKLMINGVASDPFSAITLPPSPEFFTGNSEKTIKVSRERYSNPVVEVEEKISRWMGAEFHQDTAAVVIGDNSQQEIAETETPRQQPEAEEEKPVQEKEQPPIPEIKIQPQPAEEKKPERVVEAPKRAQEQSFRQQQPQRKQEQPRHRHQSRPQPHAHTRAPQAKKEHPIWDQVASIHTQKSQEIKERNREAVDRIFSEPKNETPKPPQTPLPPPIMPKPLNESANEQRTVMQPGESHPI